MPIYIMKQHILLIAYMRTDEHNLIKLINLNVNKCIVNSLDIVEIML